MVAKLQKQNESYERSANSLSTLNAQDNVFRHLMQKIKTLEMNYAIVEMYTLQMSECYKAVLKDILANTSSAVALSNEAAAAAAISASSAMAIAAGLDEARNGALVTIKGYTDSEVIFFLGVSVLLSFLSTLFSILLAIYIYVTRPRQTFSCDN
jgi:hypothetical protein